jgi:hypothetical protein
MGMKPPDGKFCTKNVTFRSRHKCSVDDPESFNRFIPYFEIFFCDSSDIDESTLAWYSGKMLWFLKVQQSSEGWCSLSQLEIREVM